MKKIAFLNFTHTAFDDRTYYHHAMWLVQEDNDVSIISIMKHPFNIVSDDGIKIFEKESHSRSDKAAYSIEILREIEPEIVVCDAPLAVMTAVRYRKERDCKIIYDITEWHPSKKNLKNVHRFLKPFKFLAVFCVNICAGFQANVLLFGEYYKSIPFKLLFWKKKSFVGYYPNLDYIVPLKINKIDTAVKLFYSGVFNSDKGFDKVLEVARKLAVNNGSRIVQLNLVGQFLHESEKSFYEKKIANIPQNCVVEIRENLSFLDFCKAMTENDVFLDLRVKDIENAHCLPIKLFYYLACGRPVIYSDLQSIKKEIKPFDFGYCVNPGDTENIAKIIENYMSNALLYQAHCDNALSASRIKYNGDLIKGDFLRLINGY